MGRLFLLAFVQVGAFSGAVTPEEIEKLQNLMHQTKVVQVLRTENEDGP
jgi:hypothetical protein